ncbi:MAG TPA: DmsC/YnfH family molybdoenzyme membrane anchor subunit [Dokdonella sp.]
MRPTFSIICFTVLSGAGYGLLFLIGLATALGAMPTFRPLLPPELAGFALVTPLISNPNLALATALAIGAMLVSAGLLCSLGHLGKPARAWRALSQWRSSWLSREGVASLLTYVPLLGLLVDLFTRRASAAPTPTLRLYGALLCLGCIATVVCTAHIYASLKPIRAWHDRHVLPGYLYLSLYSGALVLTALATLGIPTQTTAVALWIGNALILAPNAAAAKWRYWRSIDAHDPPGTGNATGLDRLGAVRSFEQPHTEENYLTHEMGFVLARKHARKLRAFAFWSILLAPISSLLPAWLIGGFTAWPALVFGLLGVFVERWLFFAEAKHAVMAYYGR